MRHYIVLAVIFFLLTLLCLALAGAYYQIGYAVLACLWCVCAVIDAVAGAVYLRLDRVERMR